MNRVRKGLDCPGLAREEVVVTSRLFVVDLVDRTLQRSDVLDQRVDVLRRGDRAAHLVAGGHGDVVEREHVGRVGCGHQHGLLAEERQGQVPLVLPEIGQHDDERDEQQDRPLHQHESERPVGQVLAALVVVAELTVLAPLVLLVSPFAPRSPSASARP